MSQRRACEIVGQHRSTQRYEPAEPDPDRSLRAELRGFAMATPARNGGQVRPPIPIDQRREFKSLPHNPSSRIHPTRPETQLSGRTGEIISSST